MTRAEFEAKWGGMTGERRDGWLLEVLGDEERPRPETFRAVSIEARLDWVGGRIVALGLCERYALTLAGLVEEPHAYGQRSRGWQFWRLAHAPAELRAKAALMTALDVEA